MRKTVLVGAGAVLAVLVSGCGGNQTTASGSTTSSAPDTGSTAATTSAASGGTAAVGPCHTADLSAVLGTKKELPVDPQGQLGAAGTHYSITLTWTNNSSHSCTMDGYGGVDLIGPDQGTNGSPKYSLPRSGDAAHLVTVKPRGTAQTVIRYIDPSGNPNPTWTPTHLAATPPNETTSVQVSWTAGTPVYQDPQDGAVAASISPVQSGS